MTPLCNYPATHERDKCSERAISLFMTPPDELGIHTVIPVCDWHLNVLLERMAEGEYDGNS